jgi:hypothetical protein
MVINEMTESACRAVLARARWEGWTARRDNQLYRLPCLRARIHLRFLTSGPTIEWMRR